MKKVGNIEAKRKLAAILPLLHRLCLQLQKSRISDIKENIKKENKSYRWFSNTVNSESFYSKVVSTLCLSIPAFKDLQTSRKI